MRRRLQVSLVTFICALISLPPSYFHYRYLTEAGLPSAGMSLESPDQESSLFDQQDESKGSIASIFSIQSIHGFVIFKQLLVSTFQIPSSVQKFSVLRC